MLKKSLRFVWLWTVLALGGMLGLTWIGCFGPGAAPRSPAAVAAESAALNDHDTWDVYQFQGTRVGYGHTMIRHETVGGEQRIRIEATMHLALRRFGDTTTQDIRFSQTETADGKLRDFRCELSQGTAPQVTTGRVEGDRLVIEMATQGHRRTESIPWSSEYGGLWAPEETLLRRPMQPGERRTVKHLTVENQIAELDMTARQEEQVKLLTGSARLLRIDTVERMPTGQKIKGAAWATAAGETMKSWIEPINMEVYRTTKEVALTPADQANFDLGTRTMVPLDRPLAAAHQSKRIRYRVELKDADPAEVFIACPSQAVKKIDAHTAEVTVYAIRPGQPGGNAAAPADPPTEGDRRPNNFIQSDDPQIMADAREAAAGQTDPWTVAVTLERYVRAAVKQKDFSQGFATAAEVARSRAGDCRQHAVYLAALARARGIPARVAMGLVYMPQSTAFAYHMWTEVYVDNRWTPIDGTLALGGIGGGHLKVAQANLAGVAAYSSFLPVMQVIGQLRVQVLDAE